MSIRSVEVIHDEQDKPPAQLPQEDAGSEKSVSLPADFPANAVPQGDGSFVLTLEFPFALKWKDSTGKITDEPYTELHLHRLNGKHMREIRNASVDDSAAQMLACSTGLTIARARLVHDAMDAQDIATALKVVRFFIAPGQPTGR
jgi:hypothetical protein